MCASYGNPNASPSLWQRPTNQMSTSNSNAGGSQQTQENLPNLGVLEEDDEFEEFAVAG